MSGRLVTQTKYDVKAVLLKRKRLFDYVKQLHALALGCHLAR